MDIPRLVELLRHGNRLKRTARTGWVQRGVPGAESVAAHSYGVAFAVLILAAEVDQELDLGRALAMALLHDLPEGQTGDIPTPASRHLPPGAKAVMERRAMAEIVGDEPWTAGWLALWEEMQAAQTPEARLVHDADKIDLYLQAAAYQEQTSNRLLDEFWERSAVFHYPAAQAIYEAIRSQVGR